MVSGVLAFKDGTRYWFPMPEVPHPDTLAAILRPLCNPPARVVDLFWIDDIGSEYAKNILSDRGFSQ